MKKGISKVLYGVLDPSVCSGYDAAKYHYYQNFMKYSTDVQDEYESYETKMASIRNSMIASLSGGEHPDVGSMIFGISSIKNKAIIIIDV